jgi:hypothetical protein
VTIIQCSASLTPLTSCYQGNQRLTLYTHYLTMNYGYLFGLAVLRLTWWSCVCFTTSIFTSICTHAQTHAHKALAREGVCLSRLYVHFAEELTVILLSAKDRERLSVSKVWRESISASQTMMTLESNSMLKSRKDICSFGKMRY